MRALNGAPVSNRLTAAKILMLRWGETLSSRDLLAPSNNPIRLNGNIKSRSKSGFDGVSPYRSLGNVNVTLPWFFVGVVRRHLLAL